MEHCRLPDGVTSISVRLYYTMLSRVYLALAMGFLVFLSWHLCLDVVVWVTKSTVGLSKSALVVSECF